ncbi:hypothetical protein LP416_24980 [Polaromonas sp. P2-4]|nr:hypothetical protein LP416_24980 [Polaromonas sp. P2-4]
MLCKANEDWQPVDISVHPFGQDNRSLRNGTRVADYRIVGLLDMAAAIQQGRAHRANGALALHVLEVLEAFERSSVAGAHIAIESSCQQPDALPLGAGEEVFA